MPLVNFREKIRFFSFDFRQNFEVRTFSRWLSMRGTKIFWRDIQLNFVSKTVHLGPIRWVPKWFLKILIFYCQNLHFNLGFFSNFRKIIACDAEHTQKRFYRTLSIRQTNFRVCSANGKLSTVFTCTNMLSIRGNDFIAPWAYEEMI
jgi:hypothetical protein